VEYGLFITGGEIVEMEWRNKFYDVADWLLSNAVKSTLVALLILFAIPGVGVGLLAGIILLFIADIIQDWYREL
jgi:hypothetical protein